MKGAHLPAARRAQGQRTFRDIRVDGEEVAFSEGFGDLHTQSYREGLIGRVGAGRGQGLDAARPAVEPTIEKLHGIRNAPLQPLGDACRPLCRSVG